MCIANPAMKIQLLKNVSMLGCVQLEASEIRGSHKS